MTTYKMTPINNGTRLRTDHSVWHEVITSYNRGQLVIGDEIWEAPADGNEVKKGDKWIRVVSVDGVELQERGWMAYIHKGVPVCNNFVKIETPTDPDPDPQPAGFPDSFIQTNNDPKHPDYGKRAEYVFVRVLP